MALRDFGKLSSGYRSGEAMVATDPVALLSASVGFDRGLVELITGCSVSVLPTTAMFSTAAKECPLFFLSVLVKVSATHVGPRTFFVRRDWRWKKFLHPQKERLLFKLILSSM
mmetsp:Transcript_13382/g.36899  ORF Transcript_13382/g.36899 Transcript_13382/m.36899 type:complete len:113 (+) Transcript_13382:112-450(+)|eukprot:CAMPEP_0168734700 /NCGR_PEP_ID=MMETSP0724-20121128/8950_1 /TAXON_ID=265536 /ORGANISM="Amphiprora sp., Strain CCMP467" /LENGTH=112 /DNA_ID=CAMNT_0008781815 /DNA_START=125 /DNA_END=463 /DNA_ORIENTATION=+